MTFRKFPQVGENLIWFIHDIILGTRLAENCHEPCLIGTGALISIPKPTYVLLFHAGEMLVQLCIKEFPIAFPQSNAHTETANAFYTSIKTVFQNCLLYTSRCV